jgi:nitrate/nitrite transporter NarK
MSVTQLALIVGLVLGVVAAFGGFGAFVLVLLLGALGLVVGLVLEGRFDPASLVGRFQRK